MPGRTRPIEKFAAAAAQCSAEVTTPHPHNPNVNKYVELTKTHPGLRLRQMHSSGLQRRLQRQMPYRVPETQGLLRGTLYRPPSKVGEMTRLTMAIGCC